MPSRAAILTYHSQNIDGSSTSDNDHVALARDLEALTTAGKRIVALDAVVDALCDRPGAPSLDNAICLTFDDGCDFDVRDLEYPGQGLQRSFLGILRDFRENHGGTTQPGLHATSFVIASAEARRIIDARSLFGNGWISHDWWREADSSGLLAIENHGWDHNHPDLAPGKASRGGFTSVDSLEACRAQVEHAADAIAARTGRRPRYFAYPFGESSAYIREHYFPGQQQYHRCRAALGTDPGRVTPGSDRWNLPRYVCGRDWKSPEELLELLR
ncbi:MAG: polysaccharide deacetylase family protein [Xanthomonadales bacterium]|nr:polysaccharide deacetylase family protein [Xanthomonadales bacterium]